jgi:hypothetical protein
VRAYQSTDIESDSSSFVGDTVEPSTEVGSLVSDVIFDIVNTSLTEYIVVAGGTGAVAVVVIDDALELLPPQAYSEMHAAAPSVTATILLAFTGRTP